MNNRNLSSCLVGHFYSLTVSHETLQQCSRPIPRTWDFIVIKLRKAVTKAWRYNLILMSIRICNNIVRIGDSNVELKVGDRVRKEKISIGKSIL